MYPYMHLVQLPRSVYKPAEAKPEIPLEDRDLPQNNPLRLNKSRYYSRLRTAVYQSYRGHRQSSRIPAESH